ncbi:MAG: hypothetical protein C4330_10090 [Chitinophagaceae bacterium]
MVKESAHPLSRLIKEHYLATAGILNLTVFDFKELAGKGIQGGSGGSEAKLGSFAFVSNKEAERQTAYTEVWVEIDGEVKG